MPPDDPAPAGVVNLYKPARPSSAQYVYRLRPVFGIRKVGHAGTLDPFADGVLLACVGRGTRMVETLMSLPKTYRTRIRLDVTSPTFDPETPFEQAADAVEPTLPQLQAALARLTGDILQTPPAHSAVKVRGRSSYRLAREGKPPELKPRLVHVERITLLHFAWPRVELEITCGRGTYIRAIARDLGALLHCGGCCETLTRTAIGPFRLDEAVDLTSAPAEEVRRRLLSVDSVMAMIRS